MKTCTSCGIEKDSSEYYRHATTTDKLTTQCKGCISLAGKKARAVESVEDRAKRLARLKEWAERNPEKSKAIKERWAKKNRERHNRQGREYYYRHLERVQSFYRNRYHQTKAAGGEYTQEEWQSVCATAKGCCLRCGEVKPLTVDHVIPIRKGGSNDIGNIQPLCGTCNRSKGDKIIDYRAQEE